MQAPPPTRSQPVPAAPLWSWRRLPGVVLALAVTVLLVWQVPAVGDSTWHSVLATFSGVSLIWLPPMAVLWLCGLLSYAGALAAALPRLTRRRGLTLNLTGSAVANVLPGGGAAGVGLNYAMLRRWGYSTRDVATYSAVTNVVDVTAKCVLLGIAAVVVLASGRPVPALSGAAVPVLLSLLLPLAVLGGVLLSGRVAAVCGGLVDRLVGGVLRVVGSTRRTNLGTLVPRLCATARAVLRDRWRPMTLGAAGYLTCQGLLLWASFAAFGVALGPVALIAGLAVERFLTISPVTPGGTGVVEAGAIAAMIALGAPAAVVPAAVILYRGFTFLAEIPLGGAVGAGWVLARQRAARRAPLPALGSS